MRVLSTSTLFVLALVAIAAVPASAFAHGPYLDAVNDTVTEAEGEPVCPLTVRDMQTCALCHMPRSGERTATIAVSGNGNDYTMRTGPWFDTLVANGFEPGDHVDVPEGEMPDTAHRNANLALLLPVLDAVAEADPDSDGDGVSDLRELYLGHNPLAPYDASNPDASKTCAGAMDFPVVAPPVDAGMVDGGGAIPPAGDGGSADAGVGSDSSTGTDSGTTPPLDDDSGCSVGATEGSAGGMLVIAVALLFIARRRSLV